MAKSTNKAVKLNIFQRLSLAAFSRHKAASLFFIVLVFLGLLSYTTLLKREGFPPIQTPIAIGAGGYLVDDAERIDTEVLQPITSQLLEADKVESVNTSTDNNIFQVFAGFEESVTSAEGAEILRGAIADANIPEQAQISVPEIDVSKFFNEYTIILSVYGDTTQLELQGTAEAIADDLATVEGLDNTQVLAPYTTGINPATGQEAVVQSGFSRYGELNDGAIEVRPGVLIGLTANEETDNIDFSESVNAKIDDIQAAGDYAGTSIAVSADNAPSILSQLGSLENNLFTGLIAVAFISFLLITWRASIVTALFMISVVSVTLLVLNVIGYSLNTITLFSLVLSLGLFVDDATIIVEAIDASKAKKRKNSEVIREAIGKVGAASFAGTFTTILVFLPMAFISGILGSFIRIMPITIITALITSLVLSLTLIPVLSKYFLLNTEKKSFSPLGGPVNYIADKLASLPLIYRTSRLKGNLLTALMIGVSLMFFMGAMNYAQKVTFNIFPPSKDSDQLLLVANFEDGTSISEAEAISEQIDTAVTSAVDSGIIESIAYSVVSDSGQLSNERSANALLNLKPFTERDVKSPELIDSIHEATADIPGVKVLVGQLDAGPPVEEFPFKVQIYTDDVAQARTLSDDLGAFLLNSEVTRPNSTTAVIDGVDKGSFDRIIRGDGRRFFQVGASFDANDTTSLVQSAREKVEAEFDEERLATYGLSAQDIDFDFGQESDNQESFSSMLVVGMLSVAVMYMLLGIQFRSFVKPLLIFMAIPFSLLGVFGGLYLTDNPISFFVMVGLFGLIGIAVNNTILLTDYANQERRSGKPIIEAISEATRKRFRPLLTTSITTVVALLPLARSDPFWEALAYTIIFGLISSTILVIVSFPYYYLLVEGARTRLASKIKRLRKRAD